MAESAHWGPGRFLGSIVPVAMAVAAAMIVNLPLSVTGGLMPAPLLAFAPVYFWSLVRPDLMTPLAAFSIGLLEDLLSGGPPGLWAAGFVAAYAFTDRERDSLAGLSGIGAVLGFAAAILIAGVVAYALASLIYLRLAPLGPLLLECAATIVLYPIVAIVMGWVHRPFVGAMRNEV